MKRLINNFGVPAVNMLLIALAAWLLFADYNSSLNAAGNPQIGTITFKKKVAERKFSEQVIWEQLKQNSPLYNYDAIRTEPGSLAVINLNNGTTIEIAEETMIILKESEAGLDIDFEKGSISARGGSSAKAMNITTGSTKIALGDAELSVKKDTSAGDEFQVNVESGTAKITSGGQVSEIDSSQQATIGRDGTDIAKVNLRLVAPQNSRYFVSESPVPVTFQWESDDGSGATLQISQSSSFSSMAYNGETRSGVSVTLEGGSWYWRVVRDGERSQVRHFSVIHERPPVLVRPLSASKFSYSGKPPLVNFKWSGAESAYSYTLEISRNASFTAIVKRLSTPDSSIATDLLDEGTYYCRVSALYRLPDSERTVSSGVTDFSVTRSATLEAPDLLSPSKGQKLSEYAPSTVFNWRHVAEARQYTVKVYRDGTPVISQVVTSNYYKYPEALPQGTYRWTVIAQTLDGSSSSGNEENEFRIAGSEMLTTTGPSNGSSVTSNDSVTLSWRDPNNGSRYLVEMSRDSSFSSIALSRETSSRSLSVGTLARGSWYWKVYLLDADKRRLITSNVSSFNVTGRLDAPGSLSPTQGDSFALNAPDIYFRWRSVDGATHYVVSIYKNTLPRVQLHSRETSASGFGYSPKNFQPGDYEWEVRALVKDGDRVMMQSPVAREKFTIKGRERLPSPRIISPTTIYIEKE